eukprot:984861-Karenia_brevis.AAC.1
MNELDNLLLNKPEKNKNEMQKWVDAAFRLFKPLEYDYTKVRRVKGPAPIERTTTVNSAQAWKAYKPKYAKYISEETRQKYGIKMQSADEDYAQLATKCLEEGCPVDT